jgi:hypothetical protein
VLGLPKISGQELLANRCRYVSPLGFLNHRQQEIEAGTEADGRVNVRISHKSNKKAQRLVNWTEYRIGITILLPYGRRSRGGRTCANSR